ncbi:hypothetical protein K402DRAFT_397107 [Aulographum hederae CBS 113979]|uniref:Proteasome maturation factor UMP1 n=1 Tax=Aulographum hederae CBS 113979 TaxID=1176131 RepID=A0A6G1GQE4_9PEZI|nr:hypothetical protein K402DRAFT_397107 [Aulographum hederae CBS 113979]
MSLRFIPPSAHPSSTTPHLSAPSAPGVHDTLRANLSLTSPAPLKTPSTTVTTTTLQSAHPLEARLAGWRAAEDARRMEGLRRTYGAAEPIRRGLELATVRAGEWRPRALGGSACVHSDILSGRDWEMDWEDVFVGEEMRHVPDFHTEMEHNLRMNW